MYNLSYKAYQTKKLKHLHYKIEAAANVWNHCIALQRRYYAIYGEYININVLQRHIAKLRRRNNRWKQLNSQSVQEICERVDTAYQRFFKHLAKRPPNFKKTRKFKSFVLKQSGWFVNGNIITINKKRYKFSKSREYENIKRVVVKRNALGEIFFIFCCNVKPKTYKRAGSSAVGMDFGLKTFLTTSKGIEIQSPLFFKQFEKRVKKANKEYSSKKKGSNNGKKALENLQRVYIDIANKRKDFHWKLAHELCRQHSFIAIEDLNIDGMKRLWGKKISDLGFSAFVNILEQTALKYDTHIQKIDRFFPSTKLCGCGVKNENLALSDRVWVCASCGSVNQRDLLAAKNILGEGIRLYRTEHKTDLVSGSALKVESHVL